jgi:tetratricopeptide (TPR) repeat protein
MLVDHLVGHVVDRLSGNGDAAVDDHVVRLISATAMWARSRTPHAALADVFDGLDGLDGLDDLDGDDALVHARRRPGTVNDRHTDSADADLLVARRDRLHADIVQAIVDAAVPTVLVVEDLQWLDDASRAFLRQLGAAVADLPWLIVTTRRPDSEPVIDGTTIHLGGLPLEALLTIAPPPDGGGWLDPDLERLARSIDHNPGVFVETMLLPRAIGAASSGISTAAGRSDAIWSARLDQLAPDLRRAVRALAIAGRPLDIADWANVSGQPLTPGFVDPAARAGIVVDEHGRWWFRSEPLVHVAARALARRDRVGIHARTAALLQRSIDRVGVPSAELAHHHRSAGNRADAWRSSLRAADEARNAGALRESAAELTAVLPFLDAAPQAEAEAALLRLAELHIALGAPEMAGPLLRQSFARLGRDEPAASLLLRARAAEQIGSLPAARRHVARARERSDPVHLVLCDLMDAKLDERLGRYAPARGRAWRALTGAKRLGDDRRRAAAHLQLEVASWSQLPRRAVRHERCAEALYRSVGDARGLGFLLLNRAANRFNDGRWIEGLAVNAEAADVLTQSGFLIDAALASLNDAVARARQGHGAEVLAAAAGIERTLRGLGWAEGVAYVDLPVAAVLGQQGEIERALARLDHAQAGFTETRNLEFLGETHRQRAICLLYARRPDDALVALRGIDPTWFDLDPVLEVGVAWLRGHAALQHGDIDSAATLLHDAAAVAERRSLPYELARVAWSLEAWAELAGSAELATWSHRRQRAFEHFAVTDDLPPLPV